MKTITGTGDLYRGDTKVRRVGYEITYFPPEPTGYTAMGGGGIATGGLGDVTGWLRDIDGSGDFWGLFGVSEILTVRFDGGGFWECGLRGADGEAFNAGRLEWPPGETM